MRKGSFVGAVAMAASLLLATPVLAVSLLSEDFSGFPLGTPLDPTGTGWTYTGGSQYDVGIVDKDGFGDKAVRISNAVMSGSFGDWLFSPAIDPATENGNREFTAEFTIESAAGAQQPGLQMNVAPQTTGGARMSNLKFVDEADGIHVYFSDVLNLTETVVFQNSDFRSVDIATLSYDAEHNVKIVMNLYPGPHNDVVQVYIDGSAGLVPGRTAGAEFDGFYAPVDNQPTINKAKAGQTIPLKWRLEAQSFATTWEDYYRYDKESNGGSGAPNPSDAHLGYGTRQVDSLIFQARCVAAGPCANGGLLPITDTDGYLIDDVSYITENTPDLPIASAGVGDASVYGSPAVKYSVEDCDDLDGGLDAIETYTSNTGGLMYHGNGVWQYNWQTPKTLAGKCVRVRLNPTSLNGETDFFFTK
ncbi:MAG TPA: hypothetical protein VF086_22335 [Propionibacteriaceae bacterium]